MPRRLKRGGDIGRLTKRQKYSIAEATTLTMNDKNLNSNEIEENSRNRLAVSNEVNIQNGIGVQTIDEQNL